MLAKHDSRLPAEVVGCLSQKTLKTVLHHKSLCLMISSLQRGGLDGLQQLLPNLPMNL